MGRRESDGPFLFPHDDGLFGSCRAVVAPNLLLFTGYSSSH